MPVTRVVLGSCLAAPLAGGAGGALVAAAQSCVDGSLAPYLLVLLLCVGAGAWWALHQARGLFAAAAAVGCLVLTTAAEWIAAFVVAFDRCFTF